MKEELSVFRTSRTNGKTLSFIHTPKQKEAVMLPSRWLITAIKSQEEEISQQNATSPQFGRAALKWGSASLDSSVTGVIDIKQLSSLY